MRFTATLPSDLPGADFVATITARWRKTSGTRARVVAPAIRIYLRSAATAVTQSHSTRDPDAVRDAVLREIAMSTVDHAARLIQVQANIRVRTTQQGRRLAEQRTARARDLQLRQEAERDQLIFLCREVFTHPALGRIWWLLQSPHLIKAAGEEILDQTLTDSATWAARSRVGGATQDGLQPILLEFAEWLAHDEPARHVALDAFDKLLDVLNLDPPKHRDLDGISAGQRAI